MPTDNRLKYIDSQIAELGSQGLINSVVDQASSSNGDGWGMEGFRRFGESEGFEGGVHLGRARTMFVVFAAVIMILYVLDE
jgi:hypothetical protein